MGWETGKLGELAGVVGKSCPAEHLNLVRPVPLGPCNCVLLCCLCGAVSVRFVVNFDGILLSFVLDLIIPPGDLHFVPLHLYPSSRMALIRNNWTGSRTTLQPTQRLSCFLLYFFFFVTLGNKIKWCGHRKASRLSRFLCRKSRHVTIIALCIALPFLSLDCKSPAPCAMCHRGWTTAKNPPLLASWPADCGL